VIASKEIVDHFRETRSLLASLLHLLMGPWVIILVSFSLQSNAKAAGVLGGMISIFALVSVFVGGMNVAMDLMAAERERRSLLPLLLTPVSRLTVVIGKWLATCVFSLLGLTITLAAFAAAGLRGSTPSPLFSGAGMLCWMLLGLLPLALLAAALQLAISTACRTAKEAQTYLSLLIFVPMGIAMFLVFFPDNLTRWAAMLPIAGQQVIAQTILHGGEWPIQPAIVIALVTIWLAIATVVIAGKLLERDDVVYAS
jgi:sodium transport system permease protein